MGKREEFWRAGGKLGPSRESVYLWVDNYCRANPFNELVTGAHALFDERTGKP